MAGRPEHHRPSIWQPPSTLEEYRIISPLSRGGMGEVFLAHDTLLDRPVAIKFISARNPDLQMQEQFLTEARATARIHHPNVVSIYRVGEIDGRPYIVSEFIRGQSLDALPRPVAWPRVRELAVELARGLAAAHRRGVLHRDIKPGNAIISHSGEVKLLDFGLAEFTDRNAVSIAPPAELLNSAVSIPAISGTAVTMEIPGESSGGTSISYAPDRYRAVPADAAAIPVSPIPPSQRALELTAEDAPLSPSSEAPAQHGGSLRILHLTARSLDERHDWPGGSHNATPHIVGTPNYMAPEIWLGEPSTCQSDVYAMGSLLYELCTGIPPHYDPLDSIEDLCRKVNSEDVAPLAKLVPNIDPHFAAIINRCLHRRSEERFASGEELCDALEQHQVQPQPVVAPEGNPYRGLFAFEAEHRSLFFGRKNEIGTVIERLRTEACVVIAADSGIGKSSLCRAGILPLISEGVLGGGRQWTVIHMIPGRTPLAVLTAALAPLLKTSEAQLTTRLRADPTSIGRELHLRLGERSGIVLYIDQLEELVTIADLEEAALVGQVLGRLHNRIAGVRMLMTARSDFLARIAELPAFGDGLSRVLYFLRAMTAEKIREAIVSPALVKRVRFESEALVDLLVDETGKAEGSLPLLQFALTELWDARRGDVITRQSLDAIGGVSGALARHADHVVLGLPTEQRHAARRILMLLVSIDGTRARRSEAELGGNAATRLACEALVRGRLIVAQATGDGVVYEVAHEALLSGWSTLRRWLEEFAESRAVKQRLETATAEWMRLGRARQTLWSTPQLAELELLDAADITDREQDFLNASRRTVRKQRWIRFSIIVTFPLLLGMVYGGIRYQHMKEKRLQVAEHLRRGQELFFSARVRAGEIDALRRQAFTAFDAQTKDEGEKRWSQALKLAQENEETVGLASQALEAVLIFDPGRDDARELLADVLFEGALAAERDRHLPRRDDLLRRMALYDRQGARSKRWHAPAQVIIETNPSGAQVALQEYVDDNQQRRQLGSSSELGQTPLRELSLKRGSYLFSFTLPGRIPVRYPVVLKRGEKLHIPVELPTNEEIPPGYSYIPAGRFLFGTTQDETVRQGFLSTVPAHENTSAAYLIGRTEVTYGDWLNYLNDLSPAERAARAIRVAKGAMGGGVELTQTGGGAWQLMLQPVAQTYRARTGGMIFYASRATQRDHDWLRLPVSGIGPQDIRAYASWLDRTGRLPGARLCTEREWERAARGADDRELPHGNNLDPADANFDETYGKAVSNAGPNMVGSHPTSESPFGLLDMAGNVFEWTESSLAPNELVIRSGSYFMAAIAARSTNRTPVDPSFRDPGIGARICASFRAK